MLFLPTKTELVTAYRARRSHHDELLAGALAYTAMLSIAPLFLVVLGIAGIFYQHEALHVELISGINQLVGSEAGNLIRQALDAGEQSMRGYIATFIGGSIALIGAVRIFYQLQQSANIIWDVPLTQAFSQKTILRYMTLFAIIGLTSALIIASTIASAILSTQSSLILKILQAGTSFGSLALLFSLLYKMLPETPVRFTHVWFAGIFTALLFNIGKYALAWYLAVGSVGSIYGAAGSLVVLMVWLYYAAQLFLYGLELVRARQLGQ